MFNLCVLLAFWLGLVVSEGRPLRPSTIIAAWSVARLTEAAWLTTLVTWLAKASPLTWLAEATLATWMAETTLLTEATLLA